MQEHQSVDRVSSTGTPTLSPSRSHASSGNHSTRDSSNTSNAEVSTHPVAALSPTYSAHHPVSPIGRPIRSQSRIVRLYESFTEWWYVEIVCILLSIGCMVAVIVILCTADGTALQDWKFMIQPNSLVSVFLAVAKSSLLLPVTECISQAKWIQFEEGSHPLIRLQEYDDASRGPWGALQLMLHSKRRGLVASFGALLTILALAIDPFMQQIIAYPSRQVATNSATASQMAVRNLEYIDQISMNGAVLNGIYIANWASSTTNCTTSSCTWPEPVTSLGVCSSCRDITAITNASCRALSRPLVPTNRENWTFKTTNCTYFLTEALSFNTYIHTIHFPSANGRPSEHASQWTQFKLASPDVANGLGNFVKRNRTYLATVLAYSTFFNDQQKGLPDVSPEDLSPEISACGLYWCGQLYNRSRVVNGSLVDVNPTASFDLNIAYGSDGETAFIQTDQTRSDVLRIPKSDRSLFPANDTFSVSQTVHLKLSHFFYNLFNVTKIGGNEDFSDFPEADVGLFGIGDVIFKDRNISQAFHNIALSMTEQVRISNSSYMVAGVAWDSETYVLVRWSWITLPIVVQCMAVVILVTTIGANRGKKQRLWKSSSLALLFHRVHGLQEDYMRVESVQKMQEVSKNTRAQLSLDCNELVFQRTP